MHIHLDTVPRHKCDTNVQKHHVDVLHDNCQSRRQQYCEHWHQCSRESLCKFLPHLCYAMSGRSCLYRFSTYDTCRSMCSIFVVHIKYSCAPHWYMFILYMHEWEHPCTCYSMKSILVSILNTPVVSCDILILEVNALLQIHLCTIYASTVLTPSSVRLMDIFLLLPFTEFTKQLGKRKSIGVLSFM